MSELEDEAVRTVLKRISELEKLTAAMKEKLDYIADHGGCWTYHASSDDRDLLGKDRTFREGGRTLAGQDFYNTTHALREDLATLREHLQTPRLGGVGVVLRSAGGPETGGEGTKL